MKMLLTLLLVGMVHAAAIADWELVWNDEFDYTGLPDTAKWGYDVGTGSNGWGNNELQYYTRDSLKNARVENGTLIITAAKEAIKQSGYTSARLITKNKGDWLYGRFEIAAKVPKGVGLWPAIWMLPTDWEYGNWPSSGELDIMENVGFDSMRVHFNIHTEAYNHSIGTNKGATITLDDPHTTFNVYAMEWYEDSVLFFANDKKTFTFKKEPGDYKVWPFDKRFHLLLNIAVGGSWGGTKGVDDAVFPRSMMVEYVRVYRKSVVGVGVVPGGARAVHPLLLVRNRELVITGKQSGAVTIYSVSGKRVFTAALDATSERNWVPCTLSPGFFVAEVNAGMFTVRQRIVVEQ